MDSPGCVFKDPPLCPIDLLEGAPLSWEDVWEPPGDTAQDDLPLQAMRASVPAPVGTRSGLEVLEQYAGRGASGRREGAWRRRVRLVQARSCVRGRPRPGRRAA